LQNRLLLSGFSAQGASGAVEELRNNLNRLAFQALPQLDLEMQGFLARLDPDTQQTLDRFTQTLIDMGIAPVDAITAIGEAMRGNFGPISQLLGQPINSTQEFQAAMQSLRQEAALSGSEVVRILQRLADGSITVEQAVRQMREAFVRDFEGSRTALEENGDVIMALLGQLTEEELAFLGEHTAIFGAGIPGPVKELSKRFQEFFADVAKRMKEGQEPLKEYKDANVREINEIIAFWEKVDPAIAEEFKKVRDQYTTGRISLTQYQMEVERILNEAAALYPQYAAVVEQQTARIIAAINQEIVALQRLIAMRRAAAMGGGGGGPSAGPGVPVPTPQPTPNPLPHLPVPAPGMLRGFAHGGIVTRPTVGLIGEAGPEAVIPLNRAAIRQPLIIQVGDTALATVILEILGDEISLREPSLGLG
jgi:hypothetical protein